MEPSERRNEQNRVVSETLEPEENGFFENTSGKNTDALPEERPNGVWPSPYRSRTVWWVVITAVLVAAAVLLTFTLTSSTLKKKYSEALEEWKLNPIDDSTAEQHAENLKTLENILKELSLYADTMDAEAMLKAAFKAYVAASGDQYAVFYTEEEYLAMNEANNGQYVGIGVSFSKKVLNFDDETHTVFSVRFVEKDSPAAIAGIRVGDCISAVRNADGIMKTITELGDQAVSAIRGEEGTPVELTVLRPSGDTYEPFSATCMRTRMESVSAYGWVLDGNPSVAVIRISGFELNTPTQFCRAVDACRKAGATKFVFDVRDNPGGDLRSVRAILSYFLKEGDLILKAINKDGEVAQETRCESVVCTGAASGCSVSEEQIGQYRNLNFSVLCDENSASAAEVFTATLRDFGLSRMIVGKKTFGKGIMQSLFELPFKGMKAYIKLTTNTYVTQCGVSYHGKGIEPNISVDRLAGTGDISVDSLTWEQDIQLQTAVAKLTAIEE